MHVAVALSEGQANLIRRLIEIAKNNRLFSAEFEGDPEACEQLQGLAKELTKQFSLSQEKRRNIMVPIKSAPLLLTQRRWRMANLGGTFPASNWDCPLISFISNFAN